MQYFVYVAIERKEAILDPAGKAVEHALSSLGLGAVKKVRIGKVVRLSIEAANESAAEAIASKAANELLANPIMEEYSILDVTLEPHMKRYTEA